MSIGISNCPKALRGLFLFGLFWSSFTSAQWYNEDREIMGTSINLTFWAGESQQAQSIAKAVFDEFIRLDNALSPYIETSELSRVNRDAASQVVEISEEMVRLLDKALYYGKLSDGAFDISFASLGKFYNYRKGQQPTEEQLLDFRAAIGYQKIYLDRVKRRVSFGHPKLTIDLGGIAKGYAVDKAIDILRKHGVEHASISAGGDSRLMGDKIGRPWIVGIKHPRLVNNRLKTADKPNKSALVLPLENTAISTSGDYERYFIDVETGERIHHIMTPATGRSASSVMSVTILAEKSFDADPLSTSVFVMGTDEGLELINRLQHVEAIIIDSKGKVHYSDGLVSPQIAK